MRRVIYATKSEDLRKEMADYDARTQAMQTKHDEQYSQYRQRINEEQTALEKEVRDAIGPSSIEDIVVTAQLSWDLSATRDESQNSFWRVYIKVNDNRKWDEGSALSWHYDVDLDKDGEVKKETGSWSGLKATTASQIEDLKESVRLMEIIGSLDWKALLKRAKIDYSDFIDEENSQSLNERKKTRPDYENQIAAAEVEEYIGQNVWILLSGSPSSQWGNARTEYYAKVSKQTPSRYIVDMVPAKYIGTESASVYTMTDVTVSKANFLAKVVKPIETYTE